MSQTDESSAFGESLIGARYSVRYWKLPGYRLVARWPILDALPAALHRRLPRFLLVAEYGMCTSDIPGCVPLFTQWGGEVDPGDFLPFLPVEEDLPQFPPFDESEP